MKCSFVSALSVICFAPSSVIVVLMLALVSGLSGCSSVCGKPLYELPLTSGFEALSSSGNSLVVWASRSDRIVTWNWEDLHKEPVTLSIPITRHAARISDGLLFDSAESSPSGPSSYLMFYESGPKETSTLASVDHPWYCRSIRNSQNGRYGVMLTKADFTYVEPSKRFAVQQFRVGIVDGALREVKWLPIDGFKGPYNSTMATTVISEDGRFAAAVGRKNGNWVMMLDTQKGEVLWEEASRAYLGLTDAAFAADAKRLYAVGGTSGVYMYNVETGENEGYLRPFKSRKPKYGHRATTVAASPDGCLVAAGTGPRGDVYIWNANSHEKLMTIKTGNATIRGLAFSPDSKLLATVGVKGPNIKVWAMPKIEYNLPENSSER